jgi:hypothetical protein
MSLQLHRPDGKGGLEVRTAADEDHRDQLRSARWGSSLGGGRLPELSNPEMDPTSTPRAVAFWVALGVITFVVLVLGYGGVPFLNLAPLWRL